VNDHWDRAGTVYAVQVGALKGHLEEYPAEKKADHFALRVTGSKQRNERMVAQQGVFTRPADPRWNHAEAIIKAQRSQPPVGGFSFFRIDIRAEMKHEFWDAFAR
jgi:hypothetical protein